LRRTSDRSAGIATRASLVLLVALLTLFAFHSVRANGEQSRRRIFEEAATERTNAINLSVRDQIFFLQSIVGLYAASHSVEREEFRVFTFPLIRQKPEVRAMAWAPRTPSVRRGAMETAARRDGLGDFSFWERSDSGDRRSAAARPEYYPLFFVQRRQGNPSLLGFDLASDSTLRTAIHQAIATGLPIASPPVRLPTDTGPPDHFLILQPIFTNLGEESGLSRRDLKGFAVGIYRIGDFIEDAISSLGPAGNDKFFFDGERLEPFYHHKSRVGRRETGFAMPSLSSLRAGPHCEDRIEVAGRTWVMVQIPAGGFAGAGPGIAPWLILLVGLLLSVAMAVHFIHSYRAERRARAAAREISAGNEKFHSLFESSRDALMVITPPSWRITLCNEAAVRMFGAGDETSFTSREPWAWSPARQPDGRDSAEKAGTMIETAMREGAHLFEWTHRRMNGEEFPATVKLSRVKNGDSTFLQATVRDLSEHKSLEAQLFQSQKMDAVGRLAGGVAHDFNNNLTVMLSEIEMLQAERLSDAEMGQGLETIRAAVMHSADLTGQLLAFSRRQVLLPRLVDLGAVVRDMKGMLKRIIQESIRVVVSVPAEPALAWIDSGQIEQVVMNLAVNARDAMPEGGMLSIMIEPTICPPSCPNLASCPISDSCVQLRISDTGVGMDEATRLRIFEPFFTTKEAGKGTGLGLSTVWGIVNQSGGHILVDSKPGEGTTFRIYFPRAEAAAAPAEEPAIRSATRLPRGNETILLVEDDASVRRSVTRILERAGYHVIVAENGSGALDALAAIGEPVHLALSDLVMPGMNGRELAIRLAVIHPEIRIILMSGYDEDTARSTEIPTGVGLLAKPFESRTLLERIREALA
jgi:PAS domain S-box-containing protein